MNDVNFKRVAYALDDCYWDEPDDEQALQNLAEKFLAQPDIGREFLAALDLVVAAGDRAQCRILVENHANRYMSGGEEAYLWLRTLKERLDSSR